MPKVSVILPVYNSEKYIARALKSLIYQTLKDIELIIIDDGSTDKSKYIIKHTLEKNVFVNAKFISRENHGVTYTRNEGLSLATADYILFIDSDDWIENNALEMMLDKALMESADIVVSDYYIEKERKTSISKQEVLGNPINNIKSLLVNDIQGFTWNKLIRRGLIVDFNISFPSDINYLEDFIFILNCFYHSKKIAYIDNAFVHYNKCNENSISSNISNARLHDIYSAVKEIEQFLATNSLVGELEYEFNLFKLYQNYILLNAYGFKVKKELFVVNYDFIGDTKLNSYAKFLLMLVSQGYVSVARFFFLSKQNLSALL